MREKLMKNMGYLIVVLDIAIYFIMSYMFVEKLNVDILAVIVNGGLLFVGAIIANASMMRQGILSGHDNEKFKETLRAHIEQKQKVYLKLNYFQTWLDEDYLKLLEMGRTVYVNSAGYDYEEVFAENGKIKNDFKIAKPKPVVYTKWHKKSFAWVLRLCRWLFSDEWKLYRQHKWLIRQAEHYRITRLTVTDLLNIDNTNDPNDFKINENKYMARQDAKALVSRLVFSILLQAVSFGFYGFNMITFLQQMLCVVLILLTSTFSMFSAYSFVVKTYRGSIIMKINKIEEFDKSADSDYIERLKQKAITIKQQELEEVKEEKYDVGIHTEISEPAKSDLVEEIHRESEFGEEDNISGNTDTGV